MRLRRYGFSLLSLTLCLPAFAQEQRAAIEGVARDTQGGVVPGVAVQARGATGLAVAVVTDARGPTGSRRCRRGGTSSSRGSPGSCPPAWSMSS